MTFGARLHAAIARNEVRRDQVETLASLQCFVRQRVHQPARLVPAFDLVGGIG